MIYTKIVGLIVLLASVGFVGGFLPNESRRADLVQQLHTYSFKGKAQQLDRLLTKYPDLVNEVQNNMFKNTALHNAVRAKQIQVVLVLLQRGALVTRVNNAHRTPLHLAAIDGNLKIVNALINAGAGIHARDQFQSAPMHYAASFGHVEVVDSLLKNGAELDQLDIFGSPLHHAVSQNHLAVVKRLLVARAKVNQINRDNRTPLELASYQKNAPICALLKASGARPTLYSAVLEDDEEFCKKHLKNNPQALFVRDASGNSLLHLAAIGNSTKCVGLLLSSGLDVNGENKAGSTSLHHAVRLGSRDVATFLLSKGAIVNKKDQFGLGPLHIAAELGDIVTVQMLLGNKAKLDQADERNGDYPLHYAVKSGHVLAASILLSHGADANCQNAEKQTPLHYAVTYQEQNLPLIKLLIQYKGDIDIRDSSGVSPLMVAKNRSKLEKLLKGQVGK